MGSISDLRCRKCGDYMDKHDSHYGHCLKCENSGSTSEASAQATLLRCGYAVAKVVNPTSPTDLVCSVDGEWIPIQVKTAYQDGGRLIANLCKTTRTGRERYTEREARAFVIVAPLATYVVPNLPDLPMRPSLSTLDKWRVSGDYIRAFTPRLQAVRMDDPWSAQWEQQEIPFPEISHRGYYVFEEWHCLFGYVVGEGVVFKLYGKEPYTHHRCDAGFQFMTALIRASLGGGKLRKVSQEEFGRLQKECANRG